MKFLSFVVASVILISQTSNASACLWDYDTLKQERARFPDTLEIITGKFLRHSKEFYEWRIQDRLKRIPSDSKNAALYDDLAVAYLKTGQVNKAIETMLEVEKFEPGRYETHANLSVFYFVQGDLKTALERVNKALEINPNAHFGREKYQKWLTEYVIEQRTTDRVDIPLGVHGIMGSSRNTFFEFLSRRLSPKEPPVLSMAQTQEAVKGVLGMMRFADYSSPILLEVLGDLLIGYEGLQAESDAKRLAARAYLQASFQSQVLSVQQAYRELAKSALLQQTKGPGSQTALSVETLKNDFKQELDNATSWYSELRSRELGWIRDGQNPEAEFDKLYTEEPRIPGEISAELSFIEEASTWFRHWEVMAWISLMLIAIIAVTFLVVRGLIREHRRCSQNQPPNP